MALAFRPVISGSFDCEVDKVVCDVVPLRTFVADFFEMLRSTFRFTRVYKLPLCQEQESIEECNDIGLGLVNGEDDGSVICLCEIFEGFNDVVGVVRVETC